MIDIDKAAHMVMKFNPFGLCGEHTIGEYRVFYHEDRLYSVRRVNSAAVVLVYATSPFDAVAKVMKNGSHRQKTN